MDLVGRANAISHLGAQPTDERAALIRIQIPMIGESTPMQALAAAVQEAAGTDDVILLNGEPGSGRTLAAEAIHALSGRAGHPFSAIDLASVDPARQASLLFGHRKGSVEHADRNQRGIFERADGGTIFLAGLAALNPALQSQLAEAIRSGRTEPAGSRRSVRTDVRTIVSIPSRYGNATPDAAEATGVVAAIDAIAVAVPPLRERGNDVSLLAHYFLDEQNDARDLQKCFSTNALRALQAFDWPGNVRELRNAVRHAHLLAIGDIGLDDLPEYIPGNDQYGPRVARPQLGQTLAEVERRHILGTLAHLNGDKPRVAEVLDISLKTLYNRLKVYGIG